MHKTKFNKQRNRLRDEEVGAIMSFLGEYILSLREVRKTGHKYPANLNMQRCQICCEHPESVTFSKWLNVHMHRSYLSKYKGYFHYSLKTGRENSLDNKQGLVEIIPHSSHRKEKS